MRPAALLFVLAAPTIALAHDTWLIPARHAVPAGDTIVFDMTSAMRFPEPEVALKPDRLARSGLRLGGTTVPLMPGETSGKALRLRATPAAQGLATVWAESLPRDIDLRPDEVDDYLREVGATDIHARWVKGGRGAWRETYVKFAKSFALVGAARADHSWADAVGMALEIVPQDDPAHLNVGQRFAVRVLEDGKPAAGLSVGAVTTGGTVAATVVTDAQGQATFTLSRSGPWLIRAIRIAAGDTPGSWRSRFTTLTLAVSPGH
jgi:Domain of unknown function (DUF4198)